MPVKQKITIDKAPVMMPGMHASLESFTYQTSFPQLFGKAIGHWVCYAPRLNSPTSTIRPIGLSASESQLVSTNPMPHEQWLPLGSHNHKTAQTCMLTRGTYFHISRRPLPSNRSQQHSLLLRRHRRRSRDRKIDLGFSRGSNCKWNQNHLHVTKPDEKSKEKKSKEVFPISTSVQPIKKANSFPLLPQQQHRVIQNLSAVLLAANSNLEAVFKVNVFLSDMSLFGEMNEAYKQYWGDVKPSRTCVAVKQLPLGTDVEIECQAVVVGGNA